MNTTPGYALMAAVGLLTMTRVLVAHHGDAGRYEETTTTISGTLVSAQLINPHSALVLDVKDPSGNVVRWEAELGSMQSMKRWGWSRDTLKIGTTITLVGRKAKNGSPYINLTEMASVADADGKVLFQSNVEPPAPAR